MKTILSLCAMALAASASQANAAILYNSNGFEAPTFAPGTINGQDGWAVVPAAQVQHQIVGATTVGSATITPFTGTQMVQLGQSTTNRFSFPSVAAGVGTRPLGEDWVINKFDFLAPLAQSSTALFGVLAFNSAGTTLGGVRLRATDGAVVVTLDPDGAGPATFNNYALSGLFVPFNTWVNFGVAVNVTTNQVAILSGNTVLIAGTGPNATANATLSDFDLLSGSSATQTNSMFVDDYFVYTDTTAPAPGAAGLLGLGGLMAARRRRG